MSDFGYIKVSDEHVIHDYVRMGWRDGDGQMRNVSDDEVTPVQVVAPGQVAVAARDLNVALRLASDVEFNFPYERRAVDTLRAALAAASPAPDTTTRRIVKATTGFTDAEIDDLGGVAPDTEQGEPCGGCGHPRDEHKGYDTIHCQKDVGYCPCQGWTPAASGGGSEADGDEGEPESQDDTFQRLVREHGRCTCESNFCDSEEPGMGCELCQNLPDPYWPCPHDPGADYPKPIVSGDQGETARDSTGCAYGCGEPAAEPQRVTLPDTPWTFVRVRQWHTGNQDIWHTEETPHVWRKFDRTMVQPEDVARIGSVSILTQPPTPDAAETDGPRLDCDECMADYGRGFEDGRASVAAETDAPHGPTLAAVARDIGDVAEELLRDEDADDISYRISGALSKVSLYVGAKREAGGGGHE